MEKSSSITLPQAQLFGRDLKSLAQEELRGIKGLPGPGSGSGNIPPMQDLPYLGCQLAPVRIFVIPQDGAAQAISQVNPDLMLHPLGGEGKRIKK